MSSPREPTQSVHGVLYRLANRELRRELWRLIDAAVERISRRGEASGPGETVGTSAIEAWSPRRIYLVGHHPIRLPGLLRARESAITPIPYRVTVHTQCVEVGNCRYQLIDGEYVEVSG